MSKEGEINYIKKLSPGAVQHALNKPFSDPSCGQYLTDIGNIMLLMPKAPAKILDLGVGTGWTSVFYALRGYHVTAQDIAPDMIDLANKNKEKHNLINIDFIVGDYEELSFKNEFDAAVFYDSLHHTIDEKSALKSVYQALKPGGILITVEPGEGHSTSQNAIKAMKEFGVTEKDMQPEIIISIAKELGFSDYQIYQRRFFPARLTPVHNRFFRSLVIAWRNYINRIHMKKTNFIVLTK